MSKKEVRDIKSSTEILNLISHYRDFLNENNILFPLEFEKFTKYGDKVNTRVKQRNSVEYKLENYMSSRHNFRQRNYKDIKIIDSSKVEYKATHLYFKQDYTDWENTNKGGTI